MVIALIDKGDEVTHPLLIYGFPFGGKAQQSLQRPDGFVCHLLLAGYLQVGAPVDDLDTQGLLDSLNILIKGAKHGD